MLVASSILSVPAIETASAVSIALSGGIDSVVLFHLCLQHYKKGHLKALNAIHIHHNLSDNADEWADFCQKLCTQWSIPLIIKHVEVLDTTGLGIEHAAREARYRAFKNQLQKEACLLLGHHQDDQAETVLFRALRGADCYGLNAIPQQRPLGRGSLFRPLLNIDRKAIELYAHTHNLSWVEDESNKQIRYDRNFIRQKVMPVIKTRWPSATRSLSEVAKQCHASQRLLDEVAREDLNQVEHHVTLPLLGNKSGLHCNTLKTLSTDHQTNLLKFWFRTNGHPAPSKESLNRIMTEMLTAAPDKQPSVTSHHIDVKRYQQWLLVDDTPLSSVKPRIVRLKRHTNTTR